MGQRDQAVRLAAAVGRVETENRSHRVAGSAQAAAHVGEQVLQATCRVGVGEERAGLAVAGARRAGQDLRQVGREILVGNRAVEHVRARAADVEDSREWHVASRMVAVASPRRPFVLLHVRPPLGHKGTAKNLRESIAMMAEMPLMRSGASAATAVPADKVRGAEGCPVAGRLVAAG